METVQTLRERISDVQKRIKSTQSTLDEYEMQEGVLKRSLLEIICPYKTGQVITIGNKKQEFAILGRKLYSVNRNESFQLQLKKVGADDYLTGRVALISFGFGLEHPLEDIKLSETATCENYKIVRTVPKEYIKDSRLDVPGAQKVMQVEKLTRPSRENGTDWGVERHVLVRYGKKELHWVKGHTDWSGVGSTSYYEGHVYFMDYGVIGKNEKSWNLKGERQNVKKILQQNAERISELLGIEFSVADVYKPKTSILITD